MALRISKYLETIEGEHNVLLYNRKSGENLKASKNIMNLISSIKDGIDEEIIEKNKNVIKVLLEKHLLIRSEEEDSFELTYDMEKIKKGYLLHDLRLILTEQCNLNCSYCYEKISNTFRKRRTMNWNTAKQAIDNFLNVLVTNNKKHCTIRFFGGEPTIKFDLMVQCIEYVESIFPLDIIREYNLNTNGTLLSDEKCAFLHKYKVNVIISLDGYEDQHDYNRKYVDGRGSFEIIDNNINLLAKYKCKVWISTVCTNTNYPYLQLLVDYVFEKNEKYTTDIKLSLNNVHICNRSGVVDLSDEDQTNYLMNTIQYARKKGVLTTGGLTYLIFKNMLFGNGGRHCAGNGFEICVDPDGNIYTCSGVQNRIGDIRDIFSVFGTEEYQKLATWGAGKISACRNCAIGCYCGGGCYAEFLSSDGKERCSVRDCELARIIFKRLVREYIV